MTVPVGGIIMWSGTIATIPVGWALCDGTLGTPDLRDRFVIPTGVAPNTIGGTTSPTAALPNHVVTQPNNHVVTQPNNHAAHPTSVIYQAAAAAAAVDNANAGHSAHTGTAVDAHGGTAVDAHAQFMWYKLAFIQKL